jgi:type I restriction enzyme S subunit
MKDLGRYHLTDNLDKVEDYLDPNFAASHKLTAIKAGAILMPRSGSVALNHRAILGVDAVIVSHICAIEVTDPKVSNKFLYRYLSRLRMDKITKKTTGLDAINFSDLREIQIPIPPIAEQRRIADILERADRVCRQSSQLERLRLELASAEFCRRFSDPSPPQMKISQLLDEGYLTLHKDGNHGSNYPRNSEFATSGVPFLTARTISARSAIDEAELKYLTPERARRLTIGWLEPKDVLLAHNATVGPVCLYDGRFQKAVIGTSLTAFRCDPEKLWPEYLEAALRHSSFQRQLEAQMSQTTRNQVPITAQRRLSIPVPAINEQMEFAQFVQKIARLGLASEQYHVTSENLFASLSQRAFSGQL